MKKLSVDLQTPYDIYIGTDILKNAGALAAQVVSPCKACIVTDENVANLYEKNLSQSLAEEGFSVELFSFPAGETSKSLSTAEKLLLFLADKQFSRGDLIIGFGGGVPGDIAGFAASVYLRGISYIQIPTTLLAAVDSSVGGKTGLNIPQGKNLIGSFWQPRLVICDCALWDTLPPNVFRDGLAEVVKYGAIADASLLNMLADSACLSREREDMVTSCLNIKADFVVRDERDMGLRRMLNFGHTIGHALEQASNYSISHGEAVAIGMMLMCRMAFNGRLAATDFSCCLKPLLESMGFDLIVNFTAEQLLPYINMDKKHKNTCLDIVFLDELGHSRSVSLPISKFEVLLSEIIDT